MKCFHIFMNFYAASFPKKNYFMKGTTFFIYSTWPILSVSESSVKIKVGSYCPVDTDVFKTSLGRLKKVATSCDQTRPCHDVWKKTTDLQRLEDAWFTSSWRRPIYNVLKTSNLRRLQDVWFMMPWRRLIYIVLKTSNLRLLEDVWFTMSWRRPIYDAFKTSVKWRLCSKVIATSI